MARKVPLLRGLVLDGAGMNGATPPLDYASVFSQILLAPPAPGRGVTYEEMARVLDAKKPIEEAEAKKADYVVLTEDQWKTLNERLQTFQFGFAHQKLYEACAAITQATEIKG